MGAVKRLAAGMFTAFSLYSAIPVPRTGWDRDSMRYALCFFPVIGVVVAVAVWGWFRLCVCFGVVPGLFAAVAALLPAILTGGIHLDGFVDTADALASHAPREKKLEILKDSHVGAFGVLYLVGYLLLSFGLWQQLYAQPRFFALAALGYVLSRCANALSIAIFPTARSSGLVHLFAGNADKRAVVLANGIVAVFAAAAGILLFPLWGGVLAAGFVVYFLLHRRFCVCEFGGNTGDLAGFLLQILELMALLVAVIGGALS